MIAGAVLYELGMTIIAGLFLTGFFSGLAADRRKAAAAPVLHASYDDGEPVPRVGDQL